MSYDVFIANSTHSGEQRQMCRPNRMCNIGRTEQPEADMLPQPIIDEDD